MQSTTCGRAEVLPATWPQPLKCVYCNKRPLHIAHEATDDCLKAHAILAWRRLKARPSLEFEALVTRSQKLDQARKAA